MPVSLSPEQRSTRAQIAAYTRWSREDPKPAMTQVRVGWRRKFEDAVDPARKLSEAERAIRTDRAIRAHMLALSLKSARKRAAQ